MAPELFEENDNESDDDIEKEKKALYTNKVDVYTFGIILIYIVTNSYPKFSMRNVVAGFLPRVSEKVVHWVLETIISCLSVSPESRPSFSEIYEIMKSNNFNLITEINSKKLSSKQKKQKRVIENRVLKIETFKYQHQNE